MLWFRVKLWHFSSWSSPELSGLRQCECSRCSHPLPKPGSGREEGGAWAHAAAAQRQPSVSLPHPQSWGRCVEAFRVPPPGERSPRSAGRQALAHLSPASVEARGGVLRPAEPHLQGKHLHQLNSFQFYAPKNSVTGATASLHSPTLHIWLQLIPRKMCIGVHT